LRALCWLHATQAVGPAQAARCIDPRLLARADLRAHADAHLADVTEPAAGVLRDVAVNLKGLSTDDFITAYLAVRAATGQAASGGAAASADTVQADEGKAADHSRPTSDDAAPGSTTRTAGKRSRRRSPSPPHGDDDVDADNRPDDSASSGSSDEPASSSAHVNRKRRKAEQRRRSRQNLVTMCPNPTCRETAQLDAIPKFCDECGTVWGKATAAASAGPQRWQREDSHVLTPLHRLAPEPIRASYLAHLPETTVKKAREGQQHYTLAELLCPRADDGTTATDDSRYIVLAADGAVSAETGTRAAETRSAAARKRTIKSLAEIVEVFLFCLIPIVYAGRPDIGEQLYRLLSRAVDLYRSHNDSWELALAYVNDVRRKHWEDPGVKYKHVLLIDTTFDLGAYDMQVYVGLQATLPSARSAQAATAGRATGGGKAPNAKPQGDRSQQQVCRDWNQGSCTRQTCRFAHRCATCSAAHPQSQCTQSTPARTNGAPGGPPAPRPSAAANT
jgi:hypothetical protein